MNKFSKKIGPFTKRWKISFFVESQSLDLNPQKIL